eukprot:Skav228522  [mRNA]  locus=scaffold796:26121:33556:- [translate_table: standard]
MLSINSTSASSLVAASLGKRQLLCSFAITSKVQIARANESKPSEYCCRKPPSMACGPCKNRTHEAGPQYRASPVGFSTAQEPSPRGELQALKSKEEPKSKRVNSKLAVSFGAAAPSSAEFGQKTRMFLAFTSRCIAMRLSFAKVGAS